MDLKAEFIETRKNFVEQGQREKTRRVSNIRFSVTFGEGTQLVFPDLSSSIFVSLT